MKRFLLIVGENYYPMAGTGDWVACFFTLEEAKLQGKAAINEGRWYRVVDLEEWTGVGAPKTTSDDDDDVVFGKYETPKPKPHRFDNEAGEMLQEMEAQGLDFTFADKRDCECASCAALRKFANESFCGVEEGPEISKNTE